MPGGRHSVSVTTHSAVRPPSAVLAIIRVLPAATPVTLPVESTVANEDLLELQVTVWLVASLGRMAVAKASEPPTAIVVEVLFRLIPVTLPACVERTAMVLLVVPPAAAHEYEASQPSKKL